MKRLTDVTLLLCGWTQTEAMKSRLNRTRRWPAL